MGRIASIGVALLLVAAAAGCGGGGDGGGGKTLSKNEYVAALNAACTEANKAFSQLGTGDLASFQRKGAEVVAAAKKANEAFHAARPPNELRAEAAVFNDSADRIVEDMQAMADAAKSGSRVKFEAAYRSLQTHGSANASAARSIGSDACS